MAKEAKVTRIVGIKASTVGALQGTFFLLIGLVTAIIYTISATAEFADSTENILQGLSFGLAEGLLAIVLVPIIYFIIGWIMGFIYGLILNLIVKASGGVAVETITEPKK